MDPGNRTVHALLTHHGRIAAVGEDALRDAAGARRVELSGRAVVPGFIDAHGHFPGPGLYALLADLNSPPIGAVESIGGLTDILGARAQTTLRPPRRRYSSS